jgi:Protein of unknown function (DUF2934)
MDTNEQMIREQAYELWNHAGRSDGRSDEFWFAGKAEFEREEGIGGLLPPPRLAEKRHEDRR